MCTISQVLLCLTSTKTCFQDSHNKVRLKKKLYQIYMSKYKLLCYGSSDTYIVPFHQEVSRPSWGWLPVFSIFVQYIFLKSITKYCLAETFISRAAWVKNPEFSVPVRVNIENILLVWRIQYWYAEYTTGMQNRLLISGKFLILSIGPRCINLKTTGS